MHVIIDLGFSRIVQEYNDDSADRNLFDRLFISVLSLEIHLSRGEGCYSINRFKLPHVCACHLGFQRLR
jgi:hypothetical protein